jgi:hypothetical protein
MVGPVGAKEEGPVGAKVGLDEVLAGISEVEIRGLGQTGRLFYLKRAGARKRRRVIEAVLAGHL